MKRKLYRTSTLFGLIYQSMGSPSTSSGALRHSAHGGWLAVGRDATDKEQRSRVPARCTWVRAAATTSRRQTRLVSRVFLGHFAASLAASRPRAVCPSGRACGRPASRCRLALPAARGRREVTIARATATPPAIRCLSLVAQLVAVIVGLRFACWCACAGGPEARGVAGMLVVSHWVLERHHRPACPYAERTIRGVGLWYSVAGTLIGESLMFAAAVWLYARGRRLTAVLDPGRMLVLLYLGRPSVHRRPT